MIGTVAITGATGYLGSALVDFLLAQGWHVTALTRSGAIAARRGLAVRSYRLGDPFPANLSCDALVHAAYDFRVENWEEIERVNVRGSVELLSSAHASGVRCLFVSSQSAAASRSLYGAAKRDVESYCLANGMTVVRPGLITGPGGFYATLSTLAAKLPIIPLLGHGEQILYLIRRDDLCVLLERLLTGSLTVSSPAELAFPEPFSFREVLRRLGRRHNRRIVFAPVPVFMVRLGLRLLRRVGVRIGFREDNMEGLLGQTLRPSVVQLGIALRDPFV